MKKVTVITESDLRHMIRTALKESLEDMQRIGMLTEAIKSQRLRKWFEKHGGVMKSDSKQKYQSNYDGLGDVTDSDLSYVFEFPSFEEADNKLNQMRRANNLGELSEPYYKCNLWNIYQASDGYCLLVGLDNDAVKSKPLWYGRATGKKADRYWADERGERSDNKPTYYYGDSAKKQGIKTNRNYQTRRKDRVAMFQRMEQKSSGK